LVRSEFYNNFGVTQLKNNLLEEALIAFEKADNYKAENRQTQML